MKLKALAACAGHTCATQHTSASMGGQTLQWERKLTSGLPVQDDSGPSGREGRKISDVVSYRSLNDIPSTTRAMVIQVGGCRRATLMLACSR